MKKLIFFIAFVAAAFQIQAQDQAIFMHYNISPILVNPAAAGFSDDYNLTLNFRNQWTGFDGAPFTYAANFHGPIGNTLGLGASILAEDVASLTRYRFQLNYAFRYQIQLVKLAAGFSTEFSTVRLSNEAMSNKFFEVGDVLLEEFSGGQQIFDATLGLMVQVKDATTIGLSFPNLIVAKISDIVSSDPEGSFFKYFTFYLGHRFYVREYSLSLEPSLMVRRVQDVPFNLDFNFKAGFLDDKLIAGLSYRSGLGGALGILLGTEIKPFRIFYSYDVSFQRFQQYNGGSHEVTLAFRFDRGAGKKKSE
ncbi:MAG: PorP/SprF family type IX secretion system membrane protein [Phaeodactylibacter sp.]|nr:PorP/SprF family type IX secretion system membrane protein [Phaeodactylibacter sp.]